MRVVVDQALAVPAADAQAALIEPGFYVALGAMPNISAPIIREEHREAARVELLLAYRFTGTISGPARRILDPAKLSWTQRATVDLERRRTAIAMTPDHYPNLLSFTGWYELRDDGPDATVQHLEADLRVAIPLVGAVAERAIATGIRQHLGEEAHILERYVGQR
jgi:hypothetical protein